MDDIKLGKKDVKLCKVEMWLQEEKLNMEKKELECEKSSTIHAAIGIAYFPLTTSAKANVFDIIDMCSVSSPWTASAPSHDSSGCS